MDDLGGSGAGACCRASLRTADECTRRINVDGGFSSRCNGKCEIRGFLGFGFAFARNDTVRSG